MINYVVFFVYQSYIYIYYDNEYTKIIINLIISESLGMQDTTAKICGNNNIMAANLVDYTNYDRHKSYQFSECGIRTTILKVELLDE